MRGAKRCKQRHAGTSARVFPKLSEYYFIKPAIFIRFERFSESKSRQKNRIRPGADAHFTATIPEIKGKTGRRKTGRKSRGKASKKVRAGRLRRFPARPERNIKPGEYYFFKTASCGSIFSRREEKKIFLFRRKASKQVF